MPKKTFDKDDFRFRYPISRTDYQPACHNSELSWAGVIWALSSDGTLKISGSGEMADYAEDHIPPWNDLEFTHLEIGNGITAVGDRAFSYKKQLKSVTFPETIRRIGKSAFAGCERLKIEIPEKAVVIEEKAFYGCMAPEKLTIPQSVLEIRANAFGKLSGLTQLTLDNEKKLENNAFADCQELRKVKIRQHPDMVYINRLVFRGCRNLEEIEIYGAGDVKPNTDPYIPYEERINSAFWNKSNVKKIIFDEGITSVPDNTFKDMHHIEIVSLPDSMIKIGQRAFRGCGLSKLTIPGSVKEFGEYAFANCSSLEIVSIKEGLKCVGIRTFEKSSVRKVIFPDSLEEIAENAFYNCPMLETIQFPSDMSKIGKEAFAYCPHLGDVRIPQGIKRIEKRTFYRCGLREITLPDSIEFIADNAFGSCSTLEKVVYCGTRVQWDILIGNIGSGNDCLLKAQICYEFIQ